MEKDKETFETWNKIASLYQEKFMDLELYNETYDFVCSAISDDNAKIADIGCGPGNISKYLLAKRPSFNLYGIDIAPNMVELAKRNNPNANFDVMDCRNIGKLHEKFDGIICGFCLPYLSHTEGEKLIADCSQLLNGDGIFYISFVEGDLSKSGYQVGSSGDRIFFYYYNLNMLQTLLMDNDLEELRVFKLQYKRSEAASEIHTILIARKRAISKH
ncbi:MAG: class I SAM-dependent methyltransferase [Bacteroidia bacterium]|nr:class I SAM-dependent methyltransferase [Bacteroidia bacterium]